MYDRMYDRAADTCRNQSMLPAPGRGFPRQTGYRTADWMSLDQRNKLSRALAHRYLCWAGPRQPIGFAGSDHANPLIIRKSGHKNGRSRELSAPIHCHFSRPREK